ncbi:MAG: glycosyltransferase family 39 protein [Lachnospiraceae bacterium]|nr:glycosyltransferase family 39 protein [Lachnospiraceae bacterium]
MNTNSEKKPKIITFTAFVLLSAVYISLIWNNNVWMDEAFTASLVHTDLAGVIERSMADTLPPLYNIYLYLMTALLGYSMPVMKLASVIPMLLTLLIGATVVRKRFGLQTAILFMMCITFMPLVLYYGVEIRMYSLGFFFATASGIYAHEVVCDPNRKNWAAFTIFSTLAGYTHHFAFVTVAFSYLYLLLFYFFKKRDKIKDWFICLAATFILYLPCLMVTLKQISRVSGYFSMPDVDLAMFIQYAAYPYTVGVTFASVVCVLLMTASLALFIKKIAVDGNPDPKYIFGICCFCVYYGVLIFGTIVSKLMTANIFVDRYLFFSVGLLWLFAAIMLSGNEKLFYASAVVVFIIGICSYHVQFEKEYKNSADEEIAFLRENIGEGDVFFSIGGHEEMQNCIPFYTYLDEGTNELTFVYPIDEAIRVSKERGTTLWISVLEGFSPTGQQEEVLRGQGLTLQKVADFDFDRYKCSFFKVVTR